ncbi:MAG: (d)CMP kinase, partial [Thermoguttaceae bacterium]|nr:(d)CMP kinase [Thermoguttaceae bacterium]
MQKIDVVTVDGPAGAGKSVATRRLAERLGIEYLNTGAMYRAIALCALRENVALTDADALTRIARERRLESRSGRVFLDDEDVSDAVRSPKVSQSVKYPAGAPSVRAILVEKQREIGLSRPIATEGRDQGTVVFPNALCKFYLTASPEERARRRFGEHQRRGET